MIVEIYVYLLTTNQESTQQVNTSATLQKFASTVGMCERPSGIELWYQFMLENLVTLCLYKSTNAIRLFVATFIILFLQTDKLFYISYSVISQVIFIILCYPQSIILVNRMSFLK